jgi:1-aminocyclopropane-1-carboxylate deaminase
MPIEAMFKVGWELMIPSPLQVVLDDDRLARQDVKLCLKRDDLIQPDVSGNKWRKLVYKPSARLG